MRMVLMMVLAALLAACSRDAEPPPVQTTSLISEPAAPEKPPIRVREFAVTPETLRPSQPATVKVDLHETYPSRRVTVDWHGPDGWLIRYDAVDAAKTESTLAAPAEIFDEPGRYRAVLRSGTTNLAEQWVTVAE